MNNFIKDTSYCFGENTVDVLELQNQHEDWDLEASVKKTGVKYLHHASSNETSSSLAYTASKEILDKLEQDAKPDTIIVCTQTPDFTLPHCSALLQERLKLPTDTKCFDLNLGCSGFVYGLSIAYSMLVAHISKSILLITADTYSKIINSDDKTSFLLFSDAASCTLLEKPDTTYPFTFGTDGSAYDSIIYPMSGTNKIKKNNNYSSCLINDEGCFEMNGYSVYLFTIGVIVEKIKDFMAENNITIEDIDMLVLHQASLFVLKTIQDKLNIPDNKMLIDLEDVGNTSSSSIPIALKRAEVNGKIKQNDKVLLFGFGIGLSWSGTFINY